ncbi:MAG TPA: hypothetical protein VK902_21105 [Rubrobacter sp.]|jgi:hypothetical protein|nr:hypothetical protein [Rubrobacter sp.]
MLSNILPFYRLVCSRVWGEVREEAEVGSLLPPSSGPTQVGTTLDLMFRAAIRTDGEVDLGVAL